MHGNLASLPWKPTTARCELRGSLKIECQVIDVEIQIAKVGEIKIARVGAVFMIFEI